MANPATRPVAPPAPTEAALRPAAADTPAVRNVRGGILLAITLVMLSFYLLVSVDSPIRLFPDSELYLNLAAKELRVPDIFFALRPFAFILFLKAMAANPRLVVTAQTILYFGSWTFLAYALLFHTRSLAVGAVLALLAGLFALYPEFASWNLTLLSESLSIALTVIVVASIILWVSTRRRRYLAVWVATLALSVHVRDFNAYYSLCFLPLLPFFALMRLMTRRAVVVVALVLLVNFACAVTSSNHAGVKVSDPRWYFAMLTNVGRRILPDPEFTRYYVEHGMPYGPALEGRRGKWPHDDDWAFYEDGELEEFRQWLRRNGQGLYWRMLLDHPSYVVTSLWADAGEVFQHGQYVLGFYLPEHYVPRSPIRIEHKYLYAANAVLLVAFVLVALRRVGVGRREKLIEAALAAVFLAAVAPLALFAFHVSPMEIARHSLPVPLHGALALLLSCFLLCRPAPGTDEESVSAGR